MRAFLDGLDFAEVLALLAIAVLCVAALSGDDRWPPQAQQPPPVERPAPPR